MQRLTTPLMRTIEAQGRTRRWVADQLGILPSALSKIERGFQHPPQDFYPRAAALLGVDEASVRPESVEVAA